MLCMVVLHDRDRKYEWFSRSVTSLPIDKRRVRRGVPTRDRIRTEMKGSRASALVSPEASQKTRGPLRLHHMGSEVPQNALHQSKRACGADSV